MLRVRQVKVRVEEKDKLNKKVAQKLNIKLEEIKSIKILKESIDARRKPEIYYVYEVAVDLINQNGIKRNNDIEKVIK